MFMNRSDRRRPSLAALIAVPLLALSLAACAPGGDEAKAPESEGGSGQNASETNDMMAWQLDYAACMREQGVDIPDPEANGGGLTSSATVEGDPAVMQAASEKCLEELGDPPAPSPEEQAASDEKFLEWAKEAAECYREHGYDMPDPDGKTLSFPADAPPEVAEECGGSFAVTKGDQ